LSGINEVAHCASVLIDKECVDVMLRIDSEAARDSSVLVDEVKHAPWLVALAYRTEGDGYRMPARRAQIERLAPRVGTA
jgi:hypothetical protein